MIVEFDKSFEKSLRKLNEKSILLKIENLIEEIENSPNLLAVHQVKKLVGFKNYYRIRLGDYRVGIEKINESIVRFIIVAHRKDIYKLFP